MKMTFKRRAPFIPERKPFFLLELLNEQNVNCVEATNGGGATQVTSRTTIKYICMDVTPCNSRNGKKNIIINKGHSCLDHCHTPRLFPPTSPPPLLYFCTMPATGPLHWTSPLPLHTKITTGDTRLCPPLQRGNPLNVEACVELVALHTYIC
jgi:hypothetical protein